MFIKAIYSLVAGAMVLSLATPVLAEDNNVNTTANQTLCQERIGLREVQLDKKRAEADAKLAQKRLDNVAKYMKDIEKIDSRKIERQQQNDDKAMQNRTERDAKGYKTPEMQAAVTAYRQAMDVAIQAHRTAITNATTAYRTTHDQAVTTRKTAIDAAIATRRQAVDAALATWKQNCIGTTEQKQAATKTFREAVAAARATSRIAIDAAVTTYTTTMQTAKTTRTAAVKAANQTFQTATTAARDALKAAQQQIKDNKIKWQTYKNTTLGFSIKYPTSWAIDSLRSNREVSGSDVVFDIGIATESHEGIKMDISNLTLNEWLNQIDKTIITKTYQLTIDGQPAIRIDTTEFSQKLIGVKFNDKLYVFKTDGKMIENGMLSTVKFLK